MKGDYMIYVNLLIPLALHVAETNGAYQSKRNSGYTSDTSTALVVGIIAGAFICIVLIVIIVICIIKIKNSKKTQISSTRTRTTFVKTVQPAPPAYSEVDDIQPSTQQLHMHGHTQQQYGEPMQQQFGEPLQLQCRNPASPPPAYRY